MDFGIISGHMFVEREDISVKARRKGYMLEKLSYTLFIPGLIYISKWYAPDNIKQAAKGSMQAYNITEILPQVQQYSSNLPPILLPTPPKHFIH